MKVLIFALGILAASPCFSYEAPLASEQARPISITNRQSSGNQHALGPLRIGMKREDVEALPFPFRTSTVQLEGDQYVRDLVFVNKNLTIEALFSSDVVVELATKSIGYTTMENARLGDSLDKLQGIYAGGQLSKGSEEGPYFLFITGVDDQVFEFDTKEMSRECLIYDQGCAGDWQRRKSIRLSVR